MSNSHLAQPDLSRSPVAQQSWSAMAGSPGTMFSSTEEWSSPIDCLNALYRRKGTLLLLALSGVVTAALVSE